MTPFVFPDQYRPNILDEAALYLYCIYMRSRVTRWGNSLAVRIPKPFADEMKIVAGSSIDMMVEDGALRIVPAAEEERWSLAELVAGITDENRHEEWETGETKGREEW